MPNLSDTFKQRPSKRTHCAHCKGPRQHYCYYDPNHKTWVEICKECGMVELADDELKKQGLTYAAPRRPNGKGGMQDAY